MIKYFQESEIKRLDINLVSMLDNARGIAGIPFIITSGYRTEEENRKVGGREDSAHLKGLAVDLKCLNSRDRYAIVRSALAVGFNRIEVAEDHIHLDIDKDKDINVLFLK